MEKIAVVMGSSSDWATMGQACAMLDAFNISYHKEVISAHRTPHKMLAFAESARNLGVKVIIAGAGGAAHLPGMLASCTTLPVIGVPIASRALNGLDSLLSIVQMPAGIPVATTAIGAAGAKNAALLALQILSLEEKALAEQLKAYRASLEAKVATMNQEIEGPSHD